MERPSGKVTLKEDKTEKTKKEETLLEREKSELIIHPRGGRDGTAEGEAALEMEWEENFVGY